MCLAEISAPYPQIQELNSLCTLILGNIFCKENVDWTAKKHSVKSSCLSVSKLLIYTLVTRIIAILWLNTCLLNRYYGMELLSYSYTTPAQLS